MLTLSSAILTDQVDGGRASERTGQGVNVSEIDAEVLRLLDLRAKKLNQQFCETIVPTLTARIGRTYVYPEGDWNVFRKLISFYTHETSAMLVFQECSIDSRGKAECTTEVVQISAHGDFPHGSWRACEPEEFEREWQRTMAEIENPKQCLAYLAR